MISFKEKFLSNPQKLSYLFNHVMIGCEILFLSFFIVSGMTKVERIEIINFILSIIGYFLIYKNKIKLWVFTLYFNILEFMTLSTMALGFGYGFQLYTVSMIIGAYYIKYIGSKFYDNIINPVLVSVLATVSYFTGYTFLKIHGPMYELNLGVETGFFIFNSILVISVLVFYMAIMLKSIELTEKKLEHIAMFDKLTGLYNRHYLLRKIEELSKDDLSDYWIAILDIDNFKKVNDIYGHNCGDYVLKKVAETTKSLCRECIVCRWGGEEFIVFASSGKCSAEILKTVRYEIDNLMLEFEKQDIHVTVTIGAENYSPDRSVDAWISKADENLYFGKTHGKNQVVYIQQNIK